jgi:hypothetical protein
MITKRQRTLKCENDQGPEDLRASATLEYYCIGGAGPRNERLRLRRGSLCREAARQDMMEAAPNVIS